MNFLMGIAIVLGVMLLIFLGPEWVLQPARKPKSYRRLVRLAVHSQIDRMAGRRRTNRLGVS